MTNKNPPFGSAVGGLMRSYVDYSDARKVSVSVISAS